MPRGKAKQDSAVLTMALVGFELEKQKIEEVIAEIHGRLGNKGGRGAAPLTGKKSAGTKQRGKRVLSAAARRRMVLGQKRRWAEHRKRLAGQK